jgi:hypothetical protein
MVLGDGQIPEIKKEGADHVSRRAKGSRWDRTASNPSGEEIIA